MENRDTGLFHLIFSFGDKMERCGVSLRRNSIKRVHARNNDFAICIHNFVPCLLLFPIFQMRSTLKMLRHPHRILGAWTSSNGSNTTCSSSPATTTTTPPMHMTAEQEGISRLRPHAETTWGRSYDDMDQWLHDTVANNQVIFLGEIHSMPPIVAFQTNVLKHMLLSIGGGGAAADPNDKDSNPQQIHLVMEHFSFDMQPMLDAYQKKEITFEELVQQYMEIGTEGHNLLPYRPLLEEAREHAAQVHLHAGFLARTYAKQLMKEGPIRALQAAAAWLPSSPSTNLLQGSDFHYNVFESMITGRNLHHSNDIATTTATDTDTTNPSDRFRGIFQAQVLKDVAMAHKLNILLQEHQQDKFLVIAGNGHLAYYQGVPERVLQQHPDLQCCLVTSRGWESDETMSTLSKSEPSLSSSSSSSEQILQELDMGANAADFLFVFEEERDNAKEETIQAYDKVGETAHLPGNSRRARAILKYLGYTAEEIEVAGDDAYNYQGVGNPHKHANIQRGEKVLDVGSGLGIDTFIAKHHAGPEGRVIGIDVSSKEVEHAQKRANQRNMDVIFTVAAMEETPLPDNMIDVVISNGAFCLAPNKEKAFEELYRVLRPGGRISVCTTTIRSDKLEEGVEWPLCMRMFIAKDVIKPMCEKIGFVEVVVDDSDSKMVYELPEEAIGNLNPERSRVHIGSEEFRHLEKYNMDELCARVCISAKKPENRPDDVNGSNQVSS